MKCLLIALLIDPIINVGYGKETSQANINYSNSLREEARYCDTLKVKTRMVSLPEVSVEHPQLVVLRSVGDKPKDENGSRLVPGVQYASHFMQADTASATVMEITVQFYKSQPTAGRVRVQLLAAAVGSELPTATLIPLNKAELVYTAEQIAELPNQLLKIDLLPQAIRFPASGLYVLIEGLPAASERYLEMRPIGTIITEDTMKLPHKPKYTLVGAYPAIRLISSATAVRSIARNLHGSILWKLQDANDRTNRAANPIITVTCVPR